MKIVRSPWSSKSTRADSVPEEQSQTTMHQEPEPQPRSTDTEGEQEFSPLPPVEEIEEPRADNVDPSGSGQPLGSCNPEYLRPFQELLGIKVFGPNVAGSALGVTGPGDE
jgi:hypothetical protein